MKKSVYVILKTWVNYDGWPISDPDIIGYVEADSLEAAYVECRRIEKMYGNQGNKSGSHYNFSARLANRL